MDLSLNLIFNRDILDQSSVISNQLNKFHDNSLKILNVSHHKQFKVNSLYSLYPYLFSEDFPSISNDVLNKICICSHLCAEDILTFDNQLDTDFELDIKNIDLLFGKNLSIQYQTRVLSNLFDEKSEFWDYYDKYQKEYFNAIKLERNHYRTLEKYEYEEFQIISHGIYALGKWPVTAMAFLSGRKEFIGEYEDILDIYAEASQLFDDLKDWKDDFKEKRYSWLLSQIMINHSLTEDAAIEELSDVLFRFDYDKLILEKINLLCEHIFLSSVCSKPFIRFFRYFQKKTNNLYKDFCKLKGVNANFTIQNSIFNKDNLSMINVESLINKCIKNILRQQEKGYSELVHWEFFSEPLGFNEKENFAGADIFQRALVLNNLIEIKNMGYNVPSEVIESEVDYLIYRSKDGWKYFNELEESFCTIDIYAEMIKLSNSISNDKLKKIINDSIGELITSNKNKDGYFYTCIIDGQNSTSIGNNIDVASNASLLDALKAYMNEQYKQIVTSGLELLASLQNFEGYWKSDFYLSDFYTGFLMSGIFKYYKKDNINTQKLVAFILDNQNGNGSFGKNGGTPLDTSFALLTLLNFDYILDADKINPFIEKGFIYVLNSIDEDYMIRGNEFFEIKIIKNTEILDPMVYKSSILTTVICLNFLLKASHFLSKKGGKEFD